MTDSLRKTVRDLISNLSSLDGLLSKAEPLPDLETARALVELDRIGTRIGRLASRLEQTGDGRGGRPGKR